MKIFSGQSADAAWRQAAHALIGRHGTSEIGSRGGATVELTHATIQVRDPRARWVASRTPAMNVAFAIAEVVQILSGTDDVAFLAHWFPGYGRYVGGGKRAAGAYGARLREQFGFDQLDRAARALNANSETRQIVLSIWNAVDDLPRPTGAPRSADIPCNVLSCLRVIDGRLHWLQTCRSNDIFRGLPHNLVQFTYLQEVMAGWIGVDVGAYTHVVSSLHAYEPALEEFVVARTKPALPQATDIRLPFREANAAWRELDRLARELVARPKKQPPRVVEKRVATGLGPLESLFWILAAEDARRRGWHEESMSAAEACADQALRFMWRRWLRRISSLAVNAKP